MTNLNPNNISLCSVSDLRERGQYTKWVDKWSDEISAFLIDEKIVIISTVCPHFGGEIVRCPKNRDQLRCLWHDWKYDILSGECITFRIKGSLQRYEFFVDDGMIIVEAP
jgi:nitrite reductase/ring-hydroxylating ferredoxin subunit